MIQDSASKIMYEQLAFTDYLTGIPNRAAFEKTLDYIEENKSSFHSVTLIMCDLNFLKTTNDEIGHDAGDALICSAATCLKETFHNDGRYYRLGGDEFAVLLMNSSNDVSTYLSQLEENITAHNQINDSPILSIAIGYSYQELSSSTPLQRQNLFREADLKMYENKQKMHETM